MKCRSGSFQANHITRVYILPACAFYEHLGYLTDHHERYECENGAVLFYDIMKKMR